MMDSKTGFPGKQSAGMLIPFFSNYPIIRDVVCPSKKTRLREKLSPIADRVTLADVLQALSDPIRLRIVRLAADRERACNEFDLKLPKATLSHHFKVLREAGVIAVRADGTRHLTSLNRRALDARFPGLMTAVLKAVDT